MYPKTPQASLHKSMDFKKQQKREQLSSLLVSKFRTKYQISATRNPELDALLHDQVVELLQSNNNAMSEKALRELDLKFAAQVKASRGSNAPSVAQSITKADDQLSSYSRASQARSSAAPSMRSKTSTRNHFATATMPKDIKDGKTPGMSEQ